MAEYIDLDTPLELKAVWGSTYKPYTSTLRELLDVNHIPYTTADVRPVVLCRDCKYWFNAPAAEGFNSCELDALIRHEDFFCACGEKREES